MPNVRAAWFLLVLFLTPGAVSATGESPITTAPFILSAPDTQSDAPPQPFGIDLSIAPERIGPGGGGELTVRFTIADGHKIYADATRIVPEEKPGLTFGPATVPDAVEKKEPDGNTARFFEGSAVFRMPFSLDDNLKAGSVSIPVTVHFRGCSETACFFPEMREFVATFTVDSAKVSMAPDTSHRAGLHEAETSENPYQSLSRRFGFIGVLAGAFLWGLLTSLTPCVYPMIPVTVSVVGAGAAGRPGKGFRLALAYVLGMSLTYAVFGVIAAWTGGLFGAYADHPAVHVVIVGILVALALAMFDVFNLQMPPWVSGRLQGVRGAGTAGVFLTGAASGAMVGPCVGPMLVGLLIYIAAIGSKVQGFLIMWTFSLGMGMLFLMVGTFSGVAASLPKSGVWMVRIKHFFGVLMLALAVYYLRPVVPESVFQLVLGAFLIGVGVFAGALDRLEVGAGGYVRLWKSLGILSLTLGIAFSARFAVGDGLRVAAVHDTENESTVSWLQDEKKALALAERFDRPVLIDFYADWCSACRDLDRKTFSDPSVVRALEDIVALRVDNSDPEAVLAKNLREKYGVVGLPTLVFLDREGRMVPGATLTEFIGPDAFLRHLHRIEMSN